MGEQKIDAYTQGWEAACEALVRIANAQPSGTKFILTMAARTLRKIAEVGYSHSPQARGDGSSRSAW